MKTTNRIPSPAQSTDAPRHISEVARGPIARVLSLAPIPTLWNGTVFRSRTEARWAALFEIAHIPAEYEVEGYDLGGIRYLPDFFVSDWNLFIEVKPTDPTAEELRKAGLLQALSGCRCLIVVGQPWEFRGWLVEPGLCEVGEPPKCQAMLSRCRKCDRMGISYRTPGASGEINLERCKYADDHCTDKWTFFGNGLEDAARAIKEITFGIYDDGRHTA